MACHIAKNQLIRTAAARCYSTNPAIIPIGGITNYDVQTTTLPNKMVVASGENGAPIARIAVLFKSGSRYESAENIGAGHVLRIAAGLSTKHISQFAIMRNIQQLGASITCTADRETVAYSLVGTCDSVAKSLTFLSDMAACQVFKPWELSECTNRILLELATRTKTVRALDMLHKAAYRQGLGNSLFIPKHSVGRINSETMQHYYASTCTTNRCAVVALGVDHQHLSAFAKSLPLESGAGATTVASAYKGGEIRKEKGGSNAYVAVATEGAGMSNAQEAVAFAVLQHVLGTGPAAKRGRENQGLLAKANAEIKEDMKVCALNANYTDSGLFGALIKCSAKNAGRVTENVASVLRNANVSDADVNRAKAQLTAAVSMGLESGCSQLSDIGEQALLTGQATNPFSIVDKINSVSTADVQAAAKKVNGGKLSIASIGNLRNVPYISDIQ